ncbi:MAG TPA: 2-phosphosulfolactate phosphatase [Thermoleophilaceae bacterium]|nr:2-phosphosulfolactate phosphatase [Actinomycetota bacterium]HYN50210.1 2-phosphosulfolactate phosphatase [Thermoleophilaceae bacterium]
MSGPASIDVAFTPESARSTHVAVVVDVLRATSTIVAALEAGYRNVLCTGTAERARELAGPGRRLAGERGCLAIEGFDRGNSPNFDDEEVAEELVLCTTNGTPALLRAVACADEVLVGSLLNLKAVVAAIPSGRELTVICSGTDGRFALEDAYAAGRIVDLLPGPRSDSARAAEQLAGAYPDPWGPLTESAGGAALRSTGQASDIPACARESLSAIVPRAEPGPGDIAVVSAQVINRQSTMQIA